MLDALRPLALSWLLCTLAGCGSSEGGQSRPDVHAGPVQPLVLRFQNLEMHALYLDWSNAHHHLGVARGGTPLATAHDCYPLCQDACFCQTCPQPAPMAYEVLAETEVTIVWEPVHFAERRCSDDPACRCVQMWPLTAGTYELSLSAFDVVEGGTRDAGNPSVMTGATIPAGATTYVGRASVALEGGAEHIVPFECSAPAP